MKTISLCILSILASSSALEAVNMDIVYTNARVSAFYPQSTFFRELYGNWQVDYELEIGKIFNKHYELWGQVDWVSTSGHSSFENKTYFQDLNFSLGGNYVFCFGNLCKLHVGLGINEANVYVHNDSDYVPRNVHKQWVGGLGKLEFSIEPLPHLYLDFFVNYLYQQIHFSKWQQIGGIKAGGGIGFSF